MALLATAPAAFAQAARNGDEYGGKNHQPTQGEIVGREKASGMKRSQAQSGKDSRTVDQLDKKLLGEARKDTRRGTATPGLPADR